MGGERLGSWVVSYTGMSADNIKGLLLAVSSSLFIGASFIVKKKGLKKAGASGVRAGVGGYSYLLEPLWWIGLITMVVGEIALLHMLLPCYLGDYTCSSDTFGTFSYSAVLARIILREKLHTFGVLGISTLCSHCALATSCSYSICPKVWSDTYYGVYWYLFSFGSLSVMSVKALGIALKLTFSGMNQLVYPQTWFFTLVVIACIVTQMNYLNKALDTFNTAVVSPIYYTMFTSLTILASVIMFKDWDRQNPTQIVTEMCGFVTILSGTFLLHKTKDMVDGLQQSLPIRIPKHVDEDAYESEGIPLRSAADGIPLSQLVRLCYPPLAHCPTYKEKVHMYIFTTQKHDGRVFYKCQKHGVTCNFWRWELEYVEFLVDKHYLSGEAVVDAIDAAEEHMEELLKAQELFYMNGSISLGKKVLKNESGNLMSRHQAAALVIDNPQV
ncbi:hypothetical protein ZWY2020_043507 [Hordeum vulgare]|nr:hypothetical protein ZWY2020_043507 [Hordeum vulgare]